MPYELPAAERERFRRFGVAAASGLFSPQEAEQIGAWAEALAAQPERSGRHWSYYEDDPERPGKRLLNRVERFAEFHPELGALCRDTRIVDLASELLGDEALLFKEKVNFKRPGGGGFEAHQDEQAGWLDYADVFVTAFVAIDAMTEANGWLEVAESELRPRGRRFAPLAGRELAGLAFRPRPMHPGDAIFFDATAPHRSGPNRSRYSRRGLYLTYNRRAAGDLRERYYADKWRSYPPDIDRVPGREYRYRV